MPPPMRRIKLSVADMRSPLRSRLGLGEGLAVLDLLLSVFLEADGLDGNETGGIHGRESLEGVHGSILLRVQVGGVAGSAQNVRVAFVSGQPDDTSDVVLTEDDRVVNLVVC